MHKQLQNLIQILNNPTSEGITARDAFFEYLQSLTDATAIRLIFAPDQSWGIGLQNTDTDTIDSYLSDYRLDVHLTMPIAELLEHADSEGLDFLLAMPILSQAVLWLAFPETPQFTDAELALVETLTAQLISKSATKPDETNFWNI